MSDEILSVAIFEPLPGQEAEALATVRELIANLKARDYSRDFLCADDNQAHHYLLFRYWKSEEARRAAQEDPELQRCWAKLAHQIRTIKIYERLHEIGMQ